MADGILKDHYQMRRRANMISAMAGVGLSRRGSEENGRALTTEKENEKNKNLNT